MKKLIEFFILTIFMLILCSMKIKAAVGDVYNIITNPGGDMTTEINVSWHSDVETTYLQYTKVSDTNWTEAKTFVGLCESFSVADIVQYKNKNINTNGFTERYHCRANLTGLEPNTEYKYRVGVDPSQATDIYYFKTGYGIMPFSFLFFYRSAIC